GRRASGRCSNPEAYFDRERCSNTEKAVKTPRLDDPVVPTKVVTRLSLLCPVFVMTVRYEADEYPRSFSARWTRPGDGAEHEMVTRLLLGHPLPIAKRDGRPIPEHVHRVRQGSDRWIGQYPNEPFVGLLS